MSKSKVYICGDRHGEISGFSYKNFPELRDFTLDDFIIICGDCGFVWNVEFTKHSNQDRYALKWLNEKHTNIICLCGNHENYDIIEQMPMIEKFGGKLRQCAYEDTIYENIYYIDSPTILKLGDYNILFSPYGTSHDKEWRKPHLSWWPQENGNISKEREFFQEHQNEHFDFIISHEAPASMNDVWRPHDATRLNDTCREIFYEHMRQQMDFDLWCHGHNHENVFWHGDYRGTCVCLYHDIFDAKVLLECAAIKTAEYQEWHNQFNWR